MYEYADIKAYKPDREGTHLQIFIPDRHLEEAILKKRIKDCMVWLDDGRHISAEQRKKAYATIRDIADFTGYAPEEMKERLKLEHIIRTGCKEFLFLIALWILLENLSIRCWIRRWRWEFR